MTDNPAPRGRPKGPRREKLNTTLRPETMTWLKRYAFENHTNIGKVIDKWAQKEMAHDKWAQKLGIGEDNQNSA